MSNFIDSLFEPPKRQVEFAGEPEDTRGKIMWHIEKVFARTGKSPTVRELCELTGLTSTDTIFYNVDILVKEGYLRKTNEHGRNLRLTGKRYFEF